jgi:hypothetical protein
MSTNQHKARQESDLFVLRVSNEYWAQRNLWTPMLSLDIVLQPTRRASGLRRSIGP